MKEEGYDAVSGYNYPSAGMEPGVRVAPYDSAIEGYQKIWQTIAGYGQLDYIALTEPGWDARPWHGDNTIVRTGRHPDKYRRMLELARAFADEHPIGKARQKIVLTEAWNEYGEGAEIEPEREFGFGYLDAVRSVFAKEPAAHADVIPQDIGRPVMQWPVEIPRTQWEFNTADDGQGWGPIDGAGTLRGSRRGDAGPHHQPRPGLRLPGRPRCGPLSGGGNLHEAQPGHARTTVLVGPRRPGKRGHKPLVRHHRRWPVPRVSAGPAGRTHLAAEDYPAAAGPQLRCRQRRGSSLHPAVGAAVKRQTREAGRRPGSGSLACEPLGRSPCLDIFEELFCCRGEAVLRAGQIMNITLSAMTAADLDDVLTLWAETEGVGLNESDAPDRLRAFLDRNPGLSLVARDGPRLAGPCFAATMGGTAVCIHLAVVPEYRRHGLGRRMVERCLTALSAQGILKCQIFIYADNESGGPLLEPLRVGGPKQLKVLQRKTNCCPTNGG